MRHLRLLGLLIVLASCQRPDVRQQETIPYIETPSREEVTVEATIAVSAPLPSYLGVMPERGSSYTVAEYEQLAHSLVRGETVVPCVCVYIRAGHSSLMEPGDHFDSGPQWVRDRVYLIVDDQVIKTYHKLVETDSTGGEGISSDTGEVIWKAPDGDPFNVCYKVVLGVGLHTATIVIEKTSGEQETFTWQFRITE